MYSVWIYVVCATILLHFHNSFPYSLFPSPISNPWQQKCYFKSRLPLLPSRPNLQIISLPETELTLTWLRCKSFLQGLKNSTFLCIFPKFSLKIYFWNIHDHRLRVKRHEKLAGHRGNLLHFLIAVVSLEQLFGVNFIWGLLSL